MHYKITQTPHLSGSRMMYALTSLEKSQSLDVVAVSRHFEVTDRKDIRSIDVSYWGAASNHLEKLEWGTLSQDMRDNLVGRQMYDQAAKLPLQHNYVLKHKDRFKIVSTYGAVLVFHHRACRAFIPDDLSAHERISILSNLEAIAKISPQEFQ